MHDFEEAEEAGCTTLAASKLCMWLEQFNQYAVFRPEYCNLRVRPV